MGLFFPSLWRLIQDIYFFPAVFVLPSPCTLLSLLIWQEDIPSFVARLAPQPVKAPEIVQQQSSEKPELRRCSQIQPDTSKKQTWREVDRWLEMELNCSGSARLHWLAFYWEIWLIFFEKFSMGLFHVNLLTVEFYPLAGQNILEENFWYGLRGRECLSCFWDKLNGTVRGRILLFLDSRCEFHYIHPFTIFIRFEFLRTPFWTPFLNSLWKVNSVELKPLEFNGTQTYSKSQGLSDPAQPERQQVATNVKLISPSLGSWCFRRLRRKWDLKSGGDWRGLEGTGGGGEWAPL